jgi:hypothetical protein
LDEKTPWKRGLTPIVLLLLFEIDKPVDLLIADTAG